MSNSGNRLVITNAGLAEIVNAEQTGTAPVVLSHVAFGTGQYTATAEMTALKSEFKRLETVSGSAVGDNTISLIVEDASTDNYTVYEVGVFTESGTLFAVYSQTSAIMAKAAGAIGMLAFDVILGEMNPDSISIGDINFKLNSATTETAGIIEIATEAEATAGTDTKRAITPATLDKVIDNHDNIVHRSGAENINGEKRFLNTTIHKADLKFTTTITTDLTEESTATEFWFGDRFVDSNGVQGGQYQYFRKPNGDAEINMQVKSKSNNPFSILSLIQQKDGTAYAIAPTPAKGDNSTKIATTAWVTAKAKEYLPLAGGTMSGAIVCNGVLVKGDEDGQVTFLGGESGGIDSPRFTLYGANNTGRFLLRAGMSESYADIIGTPDGTLTWNGKNIVRSVNGNNADANGNITLAQIGCLPLTGGTMTGAITLDGTASIFAADRDLWLAHSTGNNSYRAAILAGDGYNTGASLYMHGKDYEPSPGQFSLRAHDGTNEAALIGNPDGTLKWGNLVFSSGHLKKSDKTGGLNICSGTAYNDSPAISLYPSDYAVDEAMRGRFVIRAGENDCQLVGKPDGSLTWQGKNVLTEDKAGGMHIGMIFSYPGATPPEGAYLLNGQTITNCKTLYPEFWNWLTTASVRKVTSSVYESELAQYGICNAFVVSGNDVRLPLWKGYQTPLGNSVPVVGNGKTLGFTNGTTDMGISPSSSSASYIAGFANIYGENVGTAHTGSGLGVNASLGVTTDADNSGLIADTSGYAKDGFYWCIQVYNAATGLSTQESAQLASQMQMKAQTDLANVTNKLSDNFLEKIMPDYTAGIDISFPLSATPYTAPCNGIYVVNFYVSNTTTYLYINNIRSAYSQHNSSGDRDSSSITINLKKGDTIYWDLNYSELYSSTFYPLKGAN